MENLIRKRVISRLYCTNQVQVWVVALVSFYDRDLKERSSYLDSLTFLSQKNRVGVVNNASGVLKDVYVVPVHGMTSLTLSNYTLLLIKEGRGVPDFLQPIDGVGLEEAHPAILLVVLIKKSSSKKKSKPKM